MTAMIENINSTDMNSMKVNQNGSVVLPILINGREIYDDENGSSGGSRNGINSNTIADDPKKIRRKSFFNNVNNSEIDCLNLHGTYMDYKFDHHELKQPRVHRLSLSAFGGAEKENNSATDKVRRKSWHEKLYEKKRKKSLGLDANTNFGSDSDLLANKLQDSKKFKQKRLSWWQSFIPIPRPRSASYDSAKFTQKSIHLIRNKSRSVDQGFTTLTESQNKIEKNPADDDKEFQKKFTLPETENYVANAQDTLTSIAARFDITPSELKKLNKLSTTFIFPGQNLKVPVVRSIVEEEHDEKDSTVATTSKLSVDSYLKTPPNSPLSEEIGSPTKKDIHKDQFLKLNAKHLSDFQGSVSGVILVTPNAVIFDPNVSDPLVIENGQEMYGVVAPMEYVVNIAIFYNYFTSKNDETPIYYPNMNPMTEMAESSNVENSSPKSQDNICPADMIDSKSETEQTDEKTRRSPTFLVDKNTENDTYEKHSDSVATESPQTERKKSTTVSFDLSGSTDSKSENETVQSDFEVRPEIVAVASNNEDTPVRVSKESLVLVSSNTSAEPVAETVTAAITTTISTNKESKKNRMFKRLSYPLNWMETFTGDSKDDERTSPGGSNSGESTSSGSVFTKFFPSSSINLADFGSGIFKSPIEETTGACSSSTVVRNNASHEVVPDCGFAATAATAASPAGAAGSEGDGSLSFNENSTNHTNTRFSSVTSGRHSTNIHIQSPKQGNSETGSSACRKSIDKTPKIDYVPGVLAKDMPELFVAFDKLVSKDKNAYDYQPLFLRLLMGKPADKKIPKKTSAIAYGKRQIYSKYWWTVPRNKVDELFYFIQSLDCAHLYGEFSEDRCREDGFELITDKLDLDMERNNEATAATSDVSSSFEDCEDNNDQMISDFAKDSWEKVKAPYVKLFSMLRSTSLQSNDYNREEMDNMAGMIHNALSKVTLDSDVSPPDLLGVSEILTKEYIDQICLKLPLRCFGYSWTLVFSTNDHGFSLNSLYRKMVNVQSPILLLIKDTEDNLFGAYASNEFRISDHFYGTGETFLFRLTPQFEAYNWTGHNQYFIRTDSTTLMMGAADGKFGLWLDSDLNRGRSERCLTFDNEPLSSDCDFFVKTLECWSFY